MGFLNFLKLRDTKVVGHCAYCGTDIIEEFAENTDTLLKRVGYKMTDDVYLCRNCLKQKGLDKDVIEKQDSATAFAYLKSRKMISPEDFTFDKRIMRGTYCPYIEVDTSRKLINIPDFEFKTFGKNKYVEHLHSYTDIIDFQLIDNGQQIAEGSSLLGAAVGGLTFGGAGAIVGSGIRSRKIAGECTELRIKIVLSDIQNSCAYINFITEEDEYCKRDSTFFHEVMDQAQEIMSILTVIMNDNNKTISDNKGVASDNNSSAKNDFADTIRKLSDLHDTGLLTDAEFESKKTDILSRI